MVVLTPAGRRKQIAAAVFIAALVACVLILLTSAPCAQEPPPGCGPEESNNRDSTCFAYYWPGICAYLQPGTFWYDQWDCASQMEGLAASGAHETVHLLPSADGRWFVVVLREYPNGARGGVVRELRRRP